MEHRYRRRVESKHLVLITKGGLEIGTGKTKNISYQGLFVRSAYRPALHELLELRFLDLQEAAGISLEAHVVHRNGDGFGVEIDDTMEHDRLLNNLLRANQLAEKRRAVGA